MPTMKQAIDALNAGRRSEARELLTHILADNLRNVDALLWMAAASETADERRKWLNRVLEVDPHNKHAIRGLGVLGSTYQPPPEQKPVTEHTLVDQPTPEWEAVVEQPTIPTGQATSKKKSGSTIRIVLLLVAIVIGGVLVNNYMQTQTALLPTYTPLPTFTSQEQWTPTWTSTSGSTKSEPTKSITGSEDERNLYIQIVTDFLNKNFMDMVIPQSTLVLATKGKLLVFLSTEYSGDAQTLSIGSYIVAKALSQLHADIPISCQEMNILTENTTNACPSISLTLHSWRANKTWNSEITWEMMAQLREDKITPAQFQQMSQGQFLK